MVISALAMLTAAVVEFWRLQSVRAGKDDLTIMWQGFQYFLVSPRPAHASKRRVIFDVPDKLQVFFFLGEPKAYAHLCFILQQCSCTIFWGRQSYTCILHWNGL